MDKIKVGILGATGIVGQNFIKLLENHPWFEVSEIAASERSAGKKYEEIMKNRWKISSKIPEYIKEIKIKECKPNLKCDVIFSALDSSIAGEIEEKFANEGYIVVSNAKNHRMDEDVPLIIPEINQDSLNLIEIQRKRRKHDGFIVTNPNCSTIHLCLALKPIYNNFGIKKVIVTTMQSLSGAGYPGISSLDIIDNIIPFIPSEEEKIENETLKIFGKYKNGKIKFENFKISATCNRVFTSIGHLECVSIKTLKKENLESLEKILENFDPLKNYNLPLYSKPLVLLKENDRPQPKIDKDINKGMSTIVGRIRKCNVLDIKFTLLGNNLIRGAAGGSILIAELLKFKGYLK